MTAPGAPPNPNRDTTDRSIHAERNSVAAGTINNLVYNAANYFRDPRTRTWIIVGTFLTILAIAASTALLWPKPARPALEVAALRVADPSKIDADLYNAVSDAKEPFENESIDATAADITLKNNGTAPALITGAEVDVLYAEQMKDCTQGGGGPVVVSAGYSVKLPTPVPPRPFTVDREMRYEVKGGSTDRMTLSVGPDRQSFSSRLPYLIVAHISLEHDKSTERLDVGNIAIAVRAGQGYDQADGALDRECVEENFKLVEKLFEIQAVRSDEVNYVRDKYAAILADDQQPAKEQCQDWQDSSAISRLCAKYTKSELNVSISLRDRPALDRTMIVVRLTPKGRDLQYRILAAQQTPKYSTDRTPEWMGGSIEKDVGADYSPYSAASDGNSIEFNESTGILVMHVRLPVHFTFESVFISCDVEQKISQDNYSKIASTPAESKLTVERGG
ncbi:hypothetical protein [Rhodococcus koreensis]|uniref:hypothetical protein n=1 Tax=Rhodococcus koreensis TaxID=99653 RepID=UPI0036D8FA56